jgi:GNAT superfamily N-acetyltransferase
MFKKIITNKAKAKVFNLDEARDFIWKDYNYKTNTLKWGNLQEKLKYFSFDDFSPLWSYDNYLNTLRFVIVHDEKNIFGILKMANFKLSGEKDYSISYISVDEKYRNLGIGKLLIKSAIEYYNDNFKDKYRLRGSQYSVLGWKYIRPIILKEIEKYNIEWVENVVGHGHEDKDFQKVRKESEEICKKWNKKYRIYLVY